MTTEIRRAVASHLRAGLPGEPLLERCAETTFESLRYVVLRNAGQEFLGVYRVLKRGAELKRLRRWPKQLEVQQ